MLRAFLYTLALIILAVLALVPHLFPLPTYYTDKLIHIMACTLILIWAFFTFRSGKAIALICAGLAAAGIGLEFVQSFIPGREVSVDDMAANLVGIAGGLLIGYLLKSGVEAGKQDASQ
ncbi:MAG: VanZ family protein [Alphaproteobacteria bacterium]|nr:VanZ family protein [Alphaproteobacteria bacterium]MCB1838944.1 VanZ family protein [Alphaproteobacteria bacterium]